MPPAQRDAAIIVRDSHDRIQYWNHGAELMFGWLSSQVLGRTQVEVLKTEFFEPIELINAALQRQGRWEGESMQIKRDGHASDDGQLLDPAAQCGRRANSNFEH